MEAEGHKESEAEDELSEGPPVLPDDVMVMVFQYLTQEELFAARIVCRRWAGLALQPDVWRYRDLAGSRRGLLRAALSLAPRVRSLHLNENQKALFVFGPLKSALFYGDDLLATLVFKTRCAVDSLEITIRQENVNEVVRILKNQAKLRRPRKLKLFIKGSYGFPLGYKWRYLLNVLCALEYLTELQLYVDAREEHFDTDWLPTREPKKSSLKTLICVFQDTNWAEFMGYLMEWHAPTLESVCLSTSYEFGPLPPLPPRFWSDALAKTVHLRELECPMLANMAEVLLQCKQLETLTLRFELFDPSVKGTPAEWLAARDYLRRAEGLRSLTLGKWVEEDLARYESIVDELVVLVEAVRQPTLEVLVCEIGPIIAEKKLMDRLSAAVLDHLPALRELHVVPGDESTVLRLLDCLSSPCRAPRTLTVSLATRELPAFEDEFCLYDWISDEEVRNRIRTCFDRNPGLHLRLNVSQPCIDCYHVKAKQVKQLRNLMVFYGHPDDERCDHSEPDTCTLYIRVPGWLPPAEETEEDSNEDESDE